MCDEKERLMRMLLMDMKHWSLDALKVALNYIDGRYLVEDLRTNRSVYCDDVKCVAKVVREMLGSMVAGGV